MDEPSWPECPECLERMAPLRVNRYLVTGRFMPRGDDNLTHIIPADPVSNGPACSYDWDDWSRLIIDSRWVVDVRSFVRNGDPEAPFHTTVKTVSGVYVDLLDPDPATIRVADIAWALAHLNRFIGHANRPISVAVHSMWVADQLAREQYSTRIVRAGLFHDASEAYLGDMPAPLKHLPAMASYREAEDRFMRVIADKLDFGWPEPTIVKEWDRRALRHEMAEYRDGNPIVPVAPAQDVAGLFVRRAAALGVID